MSSRTVSVVLTAQVSNYVSNMRSAEERTREVERAARTATEQFRLHNEALTKVGLGMAAVGGVAAAGIALAVRAATEYGAKMAQLQTLSHASAGTMKMMSDAAMSVGTAYGYSASQVADAQIELTKAGVGVQAQLGGALKGALSLAAAGQIDVGRATEIATVAMTQFGLSASQVPHLADLLAAGADKALGSVGDLGEALKNGGLQAHNMGLTIDDTVGTLAAFANQGILGAEAGTQLRSMFLRLQNPTAASTKALQAHHIAINDASGSFVGITKFAGELHDRLDGLTQAQRNSTLATIFGSHAIIGATALYQYGAKGIGDWISQVNSAGFANEQAAGKLNSLSGDVTKLSAAFQTDLIKSGQAADGTLRGVVQSATALVTMLGDMSPAAQSASMGAMAVVAAVGLAGGAALIAIPKIAAMRAQLTELGLTGREVGGMIGKGSALLLGISALVGGVAGLAEHGTASAAQVKSTGKAITDGWKGVNDLFGSAGTQINAGKGMRAALGQLSDADGSSQIAKFFDGMTFGITHFSDVYKGNEALFDAMGQQLAGLASQDYTSAASSFSLLVRQQHLGVGEQQNLLQHMPAYRDALKGLAQQAGVATDDQTLLNVAQGKGSATARVLAVSQTMAANGGEKNAAALQALNGSAMGATTSVTDLTNALKNLDHGHLSARSAARAYQQAVDDATAAVAKNGRTVNKAGTDLDISTQKGRDNQAALDAIASSATASAAAYLKAGGSARGAAKIVADGESAYANAAHAMGLSWKAARDLAKSLLDIPRVVQPQIVLQGAGTALDKLAAFEAAFRKVNGLTATQTLDLQTIGGTSSTGRARRATGGSIDGPGPAGVDSVPALLAPGEHVLTTSDVARMGGQGGVYRFRSALATGGVQAFAKGGAVKRKRGALHTRSAHLPHPVTMITDHSRKGARHPHATISHPTAPRPKRPKSVSFGGIYDQTRKAAADLTAQRHAQARLDADRKTLKRQQAAAAAAAKALSRAQDAAANITGKGSAARKHAAALHVRSLSKAAKAAAGRVSATQKKITADTKTRDDAQAARTAALAAAAQLRLGREDFVSAERRTPGRNVSDPLAYVDQLRQMSRDDTFSPTRRKAMDAAANKYEAQLVSLTKSAADAATKLDGLKQSSVQLHDSIAQAVTGGYRATSAGATATAGGWVVRNGMRFQSYSSGPTAASLAGYYGKGASDAKRFADDLGRLAARGYPDALVSEVAGYGVEQGQPIITALLSASRSQRATITAGFNGIAAAGGRAGTTVANDTYAGQIAAAKANADRITGQIKTDGEALRKLIARAFGLTGYATGTASASGGIRWVGEDGPELVGFKGGEAVLNRADSARWVRGVAASGGSSGEQPVVVQVPAFPDTITVQDASGFRATMRVVAHEVVSQRTDQIAVRVLGATA